MLWTFEELSEATGVTRRAVANWRKEGMPILEKKRKNALVVDSVQFFEWYTSRAGRVRKQAEGKDVTDWSAEKRKIEVEVMRGELIETSDVRAVWRDQITVVRKMILSIPNRCAALVAKKTDAEARRVLDKEVKRILTEVSDYDGQRQRSARKAG